MFNCINHSHCKLAETRDPLIFITFGVKLLPSANCWLWANVSSLKSFEARWTEENSAIELLAANTYWGCFSGTADESICTKHIDWKQKMLIAMDPENDGRSEVPPSLCSEMLCTQLITFLISCICLITTVHLDFTSLCCYKLQSTSLFIDKVWKRDVSFRLTSGLLPGDVKRGPVL